MSPRYRQKGFDFAAISDHSNYRRHCRQASMSRWVGLALLARKCIRRAIPCTSSFAGDFSHQSFREDEERCPREVPPSKPA